jgi:hypothetical protein
VRRRRWRRRRRQWRARRLRSRREPEPLCTAVWRRPATRRASAAHRVAASARRRWRRRRRGGGGRVPAASSPAATFSYPSGLRSRIIAFISAGKPSLSSSRGSRSIGRSLASQPEDPGSIPDRGGRQTCERYGDRSPATPVFLLLPPPSSLSPLFWRKNSAASPRARRYENQATRNRLKTLPPPPAFPMVRGLDPPAAHPPSPTSPASDRPDRRLSRRVRRSSSGAGVCHMPRQAVLWE